MLKMGQSHSIHENPGQFVGIAVISAAEKIVNIKHRTKATTSRNKHTES